MAINRDLEFLFEVGSLRNLQRGWRQHLGVDCENVLEHTLRVIWLALILARKEKALNEEKIIKIAQAAVGGQNSSLLGWIENIPTYYSFVFKMLTGQMKSGEQDPNIGEGGLPCKGKEECDAYCAKPENRADCEKAKGNEGSNSGLDGQNQRPD